MAYQPMKPSGAFFLPSHTCLAPDSSMQSTSACQLLHGPAAVVHSPGATSPTNQPLMAALVCLEPQLVSSLFLRCMACPVTPASPCFAFHPACRAPPPHAKRAVWSPLQLNPKPADVSMLQHVFLEPLAPRFYRLGEPRALAFPSS